MGVGVDAHEQMTYFTDPEVGLRAIVAIHSTALGPALGGIRFWRYDSAADARHDALRLSQAMTMKAAVAGLHQGGGKTVVLWDDPHAARSDAFLRSLGRWIDVLGGRYLAAEDVGASQRDMDDIAQETPWVTGIDPARGGSGDPSPVTAFGVLHGMRAACNEAFGSPDDPALRDEEPAANEAKRTHQGVSSLSSSGMSVGSLIGLMRCSTKPAFAARSRSECCE